MSGYALALPIGKLLPLEIDAVLDADAARRCRAAGCFGLEFLELGIATAKQRPRSPQGLRQRS